MQLSEDVIDRVERCLDVRLDRKVGVVERRFVGARTNAPAPNPTNSDNQASQ